MNPAAAAILAQLPAASAALFLPVEPEPLYVDLIKIGRGAFGHVYKAKDVRTGEFVAIKEMWFGSQQSEEFTDILREVQFISEMSHPFIVGYKGSYLRKDSVWLVMEYCVGSVQDFLQINGVTFTEDEISAILHRITQVIAYMHSMGRIHRDIKGQNILFSPEGDVRVSDFGTSSFRSPADTFTGSPHWIAPEVIMAIEGGDYTIAADVWSLGITALELSEGKPPFGNMNPMAILHLLQVNPPPDLENPAKWSPEFVKFVRSCLVKDPKARSTADVLLKGDAFLNRHSDDQMHKITQTLVSRVTNKKAPSEKEASTQNNSNNKAAATPPSNKMPTTLEEMLARVERLEQENRSRSGGGETKPTANSTPPPANNNSAAPKNTAQQPAQKTPAGPTQNSNSNNAQQKAPPQQQQQPAKQPAQQPAQALKPTVVTTAAAPAASLHPPTPQQAGKPASTPSPTWQESPAVKTPSTAVSEAATTTPQSAKAATPQAASPSPAVSRAESPLKTPTTTNAADRPKSPLPSTESPHIASPTKTEVSASKEAPREKLATPISSTPTTSTPIISTPIISTPTTTTAAAASTQKPDTETQPPVREQVPTVTVTVEKATGEDASTKEPLITTASINTTGSRMMTISDYTPFHPQKNDEPTGDGASSLGAAKENAEKPTATVATTAAEVSNTAATSEASSSRDHPQEEEPAQGGAAAGPSPPMTPMTYIAHLVEKAFNAETPTSEETAGSSSEAADKAEAGVGADAGVGPPAETPAITVSSSTNWDTRMRHLNAVREEQQERQLRDFIKYQKKNLLEVRQLKETQNEQQQQVKRQFEKELKLYQEKSLVKSYLFLTTQIVAPGLPASYEKKKLTKPKLLQCFDKEMGEFLEAAFQERKKMEDEAKMRQRQMEVQQDMKVQHLIELNRLWESHFVATQTRLLDELNSIHKNEIRDLKIQYGILSGDEKSSTKGGGGGGSNAGTPEKDTPGKKEKRLSRGDTIRHSIKHLRQALSPSASPEKSGSNSHGDKHAEDPIPSNIPPETVAAYRAEEAKLLEKYEIELAERSKFNKVRREELMKQRKDAVNALVRDFNLEKTELSDSIEKERAKLENDHRILSDRVKVRQERILKEKFPDSVTEK